MGLDGAQFLLDEDSSVDAVWGTDHHCLWARGEPLYVVAGPGRGKTTLCQQLALRRAGVVGGELLEYPVSVDPGRVLYLAIDRPRQAKRSMRRMVAESDREALKSSLFFWDMTMPFALSSSPDDLLPFLERFPEVGTVFIDSLFNVAPSIADEEGSANANNAIQSVIRAGIEVVVVHHDRKLGSEKRNPRVDDVYGGRALTAGAGSVVYLDGEPGTLRFTLRHLKQPVSTVGPLKCRQDARRGRLYVDDERP